MSLTFDGRLLRFLPGYGHFPIPFHSFFFKSNMCSCGEDLAGKVFVLQVCQPVVRSSEPMLFSSVVSGCNPFVLFRHKLLYKSLLSVCSALTEVFVPSPSMQPVTPQLFRSQLCVTGGNLLLGSYSFFVISPPVWELSLSA